MINFKQYAEQATTLSHLMSGREKKGTDFMIKEYPEGFTIEEFDMITIKDSFFPVVTIKENPSIFYYGGTVLSKICNMWIEAYDGDITKASEDLKQSGGIKIKVSYGKTKANQNLTQITIL